MTDKQLSSYLSLICNQLRTGLREAERQLEEGINIKRHKIAAFEGCSTERLSSVFSSSTNHLVLKDGPVIALDDLRCLLEDLEKQSIQLLNGG